MTLSSAVFMIFSSLSSSQKSPASRPTQTLPSPPSTLTRHPHLLPRPLSTSPFPHRRTPSFPLTLLWESPALAADAWRTSWRAPQAPRCWAWSPTAALHWLTTFTAKCWARPASWTTLLPPWTRLTWVSPRTQRGLTLATPPWTAWTGWISPWWGAPAEGAQAAEGGEEAEGELATGGRAWPRWRRTPHRASSRPTFWTARTCSCTGSRACSPAHTHGHALAHTVYRLCLYFMHIQKPSLCCLYHCWGHWHMQTHTFTVCPVFHWLLLYAGWGEIREKHRNEIHREDLKLVELKWTFEI